MSEDGPFLRAALDYARDGRKVFPCDPADKSPLTSNGFHGATLNHDVIRNWWLIRRDAMIGFPTGAVAGCWALDVDTTEGHGLDGTSALAALEAQHGALPPTREHRTPSGGRHLLFSWDPARPIGCGAGDLPPGIQVRGNGGYVIAPPSVRPDGRSYELIDRPLADAPDWLYGIIGLQRHSLNGGGRPVIEVPPHVLARIAARPNPGSSVSKAPEDNLPPADPERVRVALEAISADDYQVWFRIGAALHSAFGDSGRQLFHDWSATSTKYDTRQCDKKWREVQKLTDFSVGTIYHYANEADPTWRERAPPPEDRSVKLNSPQPETEEKPTANSQAAAPAEVKTAAKTQVKPLMVSCAEFLADFDPPDYLVDGLLQRRYLYSMTAPTGAGKTSVVMRIGAHVALGMQLAGLDVERGKVLFLAGENPDDVRCRVVKLCEEMKIDPKALEMFFVAGVISIRAPEIRKRVIAESKVRGPFALVIVDTSAAYFEGDNENDNAQLGRHARVLRSLTEIEGGPCVLVTCHPTKSPNPDNLLPRGGGAFVAEVDGNLVCQKEDKLVTLTTHGKFRGPDFKPLLFKLQAGKTELLKDRKGRQLWSVTAAPITDQEGEQLADETAKRSDELLRAMLGKPGGSINDLAKALGWFYPATGEPYKTKVQKLLPGLKVRKLVDDKGGRWALTEKGAKEAEALGGAIKGQGDLDLGNPHM